MSNRGTACILVGTMVLSCVSACLAVSSEPSDSTVAAANAQGGCVVLNALQPDDSDSYGKVLVRELFRQAFLLAARDELSLSTRDAVLREDGPAAEAGTHFDVELREEGPGLSLAPCVYKVDGKTTMTLWSGEKLRVRSPRPLDYRVLAAFAEGLSRKEFPAALKQAGLAGIAPRTSTAKIPPETEKQLGALNVVDQYTAVRQLHGLIRTQGQSPELLGGLVRGYAHLSLLTETHWNVSHKVFLARSLLYAERLLASTAGDPSARAHLAYALALGGMHGLALEECAEARRLAGTGAVPAWLDMIEAACKFDNKKLEQLAGSKTPVGDLACLLRVLQCELDDLRTKDCGLAGALFRRQPYCSRVLALVSRFGPITQQHVSTEAALPVVDEMIRRQVAGIPGLPESAATAIKMMKPLDKEDEPSGSQDWRTRRVKVYKALVRAGSPESDQGEPSWTVLGRLMEEELFVAAIERSWFFKKVLCIDAREVVEAYLPLVAEHPCRGFLEVCGMASGEEDPDDLIKLLGGLVTIDPDVQMSPMLWYLRFVESRQPKREPIVGTGKRQRPPSTISDRHTATSDYLCRDMMYNLRWPNEKLVVNNARILLKVSPHHPVAAAKIIRIDWQSAQAQLPSWEMEFGDHPAFAREMAKHYQDEGPPDMAEKYMKKLVEVAPEAEYYRVLAALYQRQNQTDRYVSTLKDALKTPEVGLVHARIRAELADYYMDQGDYKTALPYAKEGAESGAGDCLTCLARCYEGMGNMKLAEKWIRECAEHYRMSGYLWFFWCKRTGHGDIEKARQLAEACLVPRDRSRSGEGETYGVYLVLAGEPQQAVEAFQRDFGTNENPNSGLHAAALAFKMGDRKLCDEMLQKVIDKSGDNKSLAERRAPKIELARLLQEATRPGGHLDAKKVDAILETAPESEIENVQYFAGRFFEALGDEAHGREYLLRAARSKRTDKFSTVLACDRCRQLGLQIATQPASRP